MDVLLIKNGLVENVITADSVSRAQQYYPSYTCVERTAGLQVGPGWTTTDNINFAPPSIANSIDWRITKFAMLNRLQPNEIVAINEVRQGGGANGAMMEALWQNLSTATYVDLSAPNTQGMINQLVGSGILTTARANTILNTVPIASEGIGGV